MVSTIILIVLPRREISETKRLSAFPSRQNFTHSASTGLSSFAPVQGGIRRLDPGGLEPLGPPLLPQSTGDGYYAGEEVGEEKIILNNESFDDAVSHDSLIMMQNSNHKYISCHFGKIVSI